MIDTHEDRLTHAQYNYGMARHCVDQLHLPHESENWNAYLGAFALYFRNCKVFLRTDEGAEVRSMSTHEKANSHRTSKDEQKRGMLKVEKLMGWLDQNMVSITADARMPNGILTGLRSAP